MQLKYVDTKEEIIAINRKSKHIEPHLHNALEIVCVTSGSLELGVGQELYHMEKGDIGFVFPDVIHHYQVLTPGVNKATYLIAVSYTHLDVYKRQVKTGQSDCSLSGTKTRGALKYVQGRL